MKPYRIQCHQQGPKFLATVSQFRSSDQREGDLYEIVAVALADNEEDAVRSAVIEAFDIEAHD